MSYKLHIYPEEKKGEKSSKSDDPWSKSRLDRCISFSAINMGFEIRNFNHEVYNLPMDNYHQGHHAW
jgi:hypothetical protein